MSTLSLVRTKLPLLEPKKKSIIDHLLFATAALPLYKVSLD